MLSAARLVKHARFAGFPAVAGCALGAPGGPRRPACRLPLQGWPGLRGQLRGLSARARARARADSSRNARFSAAQVRQTPRFARFSARRRRKTPRFAMFSATHISQTPRFAMLSARRLAKHACFARFAAVPGWVLDVLGGLRRLARALLLQCWLGLRSHLRGLSARSRLHESFTNLRQGGGRPGVRSQLRRLSARAHARARARRFVAKRDVFCSADSPNDAFREVFCKLPLQNIAFCDVFWPAHSSNAAFRDAFCAPPYQTRAFCEVCCCVRLGPRCARRAAAACANALAACANASAAVLAGPAQPPARIERARARAQIRRETRCFL